MADGSGDLTLGQVLGALGVGRLNDLLVLRHTSSHELKTSGAVTPDEVLQYTRVQRGRKVSAQPPRIWLVFFADGGRRSRFYAAYENRGEFREQREADLRYFDLRPSPLLGSLSRRLVIEWSRDAINWAKGGESAASFPVVEIADPEVIEFPGFDRVMITYEVLQAVIDDARYARWRTALGSVQGIYLIADTTTGKLYVGKADGGERILGRWTAYARDGHGGNVGLRALGVENSGHARNFVFSILRVFGPTAISNEVDQAETHYKRALMTRQPYGLNFN